MQIDEEVFGDGCSRAGQSERATRSKCFDRRVRPFLQWHFSCTLVAVSVGSYAADSLARFSSLPSTNGTGPTVDLR
jgi:hypothetical protein